MNKGISYELFYEILTELREEFHKNGRLDDSNAKLDEITKLLFINFYEAKNSTFRFNLEYLRELSFTEFGDSHSLAKALRFLFDEIVQDPLFTNDDGTNFFGSNVSLNIQESENEFAEKLVSEISKIDFRHLFEKGSISEFDLINECFGHFVRDNFRNNKEDAQYMTPQEIVEPLLDMVFSEVFNDDFKSKIVDKEENFIIMDPTCGVGTLLIEPLRYILRYIEKMELSVEKQKKVTQNILNAVVGQDKVDRMARLSKMNMMFMGGNPSNIHVGNSITNGSYLDEYKGKVDLIVTNPPFGADYISSQFQENESYTIIKENQFQGVNLPSELILLDRCLTLLKPSGRLVIVVPDSVVSAKGIYKEFREKLLERAEIKFVIELPGVTFAQAGTRTKTCVIYLQKNEPNDNDLIYMASCDDVGFEVKSRKGAPVKIKKGINKMIEISQSYIESKGSLLANEEFVIVNNDPSCTYVSRRGISNGYLTPNFYNSSRLNHLKNVTSSNQNGEEYKFKNLEEIVEFVTKKRKSFMVDEEIKHISVLHINSDGIIDFEEAEKFYPMGKGRECFPGDIIFSKINPRIYRIAVVPEYNKKLVCSNEFEILRPIKDGDSYLVYALLNVEEVKQQVMSSTSGTSSSHNRIKTEALRNIMIPYPSFENESMIREHAKIIEEMINQKYTAHQSLNNSKAKIKELLQV